MDRLPDCEARGCVFNALGGKYMYDEFECLHSSHGYYVDISIYWYTYIDIILLLSINFIAINT